MERNAELKIIINVGEAFRLPFFALLASGGATPPLQSQRRCRVAPSKFMYRKHTEPSPCVFPPCVFCLHNLGQFTFPQPFYIK